MRDGTAKIIQFACQSGLLPLPLRAISLSSDSVCPAEIKDDRVFVTNALLLKSSVPLKRTSKSILSSEFYGKISQQANTSNSILVGSTNNTFSNKKIAALVPMYVFLVGHGRQGWAEEST